MNAGEPEMFRQVAVVEAHDRELVGYGDPSLPSRVEHAACQDIGMGENRGGRFVEIEQLSGRFGRGRQLVTHEPDILIGEGEPPSFERFLEAAEPRFRLQHAIVWMRLCATFAEEAEPAMAAA